MPGQFVTFDQTTDPVNSYNGVPEATPNPDVQTWAAANTFTTYDDGVGNWRLLATGNPTPFTITINGQPQTSTSFSEGRPPIQPK